MSRHEGQLLVLGLDWNGTVVNDDERARQAVVAVLDRLQVSAPSLASVSGFRSTFVLPLEQYFRSLGVPQERVVWAVAEWNHQIRVGPVPELTKGTELLLHYAEDAGLAVHIVSGAAYEAVAADVGNLIPNAAVASVQGAVHPKRYAIRALAGPGRIAVYIGDTTYDIEEALAAGAMAVGLARDRACAERLQSAGAHQVITSLDAVIPFLQERSRKPGQATESHAHA